MFKKKNNKKGFTLIELIVVIAILAILALVAIPRITGFTQNAKDSTDKSNAKLLYNIASMVQANGGDLTTSGGAITAANFKDETEMDNYLDEWPTRQAGGSFTVNVSGSSITVTP